jgi:GNAT superfamily N-acetyltransferase
MLKIEKAKRKDAKVALEIRNAAILNQCVRHYSMDALKGWTSGELSDEFADSVDKNFYLAKYDNRIVGTGMINIETGKIDAIFVHPNHMRKGIGKMILEFLEDMALRYGLKTLALQSTLNAAEFYRACGFVGNEVDRYTTSKGLSLDCIPMIKVIAQQGAPADAKNRRG